MGIRDMFDHKYPITNLHEVDLTFMHEDIDKVIAILESWEETIHELEEDVKEFDNINSRLTSLEQLTSGLAAAYNDIAALKANIRALNLEAEDLQLQIDQVKNSIQGLIDSWNEMFIAYGEATKALIRAEKAARIEGDFDLDAKIYTLRYQVQHDIAAIYAYLEQIIPNTIYNPGCGKRLDFDANTRATYVHLRDRGITVGQLKQRHLTYGDIANKYRCWEYACKGRDLFKYTRYMYSPASGALESMHQIYSDIIGRLYNSSTNKDVADRELSVADLLDLELTNKEVLTYNF